MLQRTRTLLRRLTRSDRGAEDRRRSERFAATLTVRVHLSIHDADAIAAEVRDVSRGGIGLAVDRFVDSGTMLRIDLPADTGAKTTVLACVVHVQPAPDGHFVLGCNFSTELSDADLEALGGKRLRPKTGDQRAWERVPIAGQALYTRVDTPAEAKAIEIHNLSPTGVALRSSEELIPGTLLNLELRSASGKAVVTIVACVVYLTTLDDGRWLAGCNFIRELYDEDLSALIAPAQR